MTVREWVREDCVRRGVPVDQAEAVLTALDRRIGALMEGLWDSEFQSFVQNHKAIFDVLPIYLANEVGNHLYGGA